MLKGEERSVIMDGQLVRSDKVHGNWDKLPSTVREIGHSPDEIFAGYYDVQDKVGKDEMPNIPFGAIAIWTLCDKLAAGLQQLMAGARKFSLSQIEAATLPRQIGKRNVKRRCRSSPTPATTWRKILMS